MNRPLLPRCDYHIHTKHLGCANGTMDIPAIARECQRLGATSIAITDHLNSPDKLPLHAPIRNDIAALAPGVDVYFGVELNYMSLDGDFAATADTLEQAGFQFAIGGIHATYLDAYDLNKIVEVQHRHHLKTCRNPLVDVLVHPYWFGRKEFDTKGWPWFDSMKAVPESYARELGQTAKETGTAIEINAGANLVKPPDRDRIVKEYIDFLSIVAAEGACFSLGSDAHDIQKLGDIQAAWQVAEQLQLTADRIWRPAGPPMARSLFRT